MRRYIAFLRAINVGGRTVKMQELRAIFESLGFERVETVIASGNVVFDADGTGGKGLESWIERGLAEALGYEVGTFVRTTRELVAVHENQPFEAAELGENGVVYALFLRKAPTAAMRRELEELTTSNDEARVGAREVYWLRRERGKESDLFATRLGKVLESETTVRNMNTVRRIVDKYC
jgi:uncharacterized protein (DUF1697 family)